MENASKALIIAGGILIAILILSMGVYLFSTYGQIGGSYEKKQAKEELDKFNSIFTKFEGRTDITVQEIVTLANFVREYNEENGRTAANGTNIKVCYNTIDLAGAGVDLLTFIKNNSTYTDSSGDTKIRQFQCENIESDDAGQIIKINFEIVI